MKRKLLSKLLNSDAAMNLTGVLATVENELLTSAKAVDDALETGRIDTVPEVEDRREALLSLLQAIATDSMQDVWVAEQLSEFVDDPDAAERHVGVDAETWDQRKTAWAEMWRDAGAEGSDDALAAHHVQETFGCDLTTFEDRVVGFDSSREAERLFAANFRAVKDVLDAAADQVGDDE